MRERGRPPEGRGRGRRTALLVASLAAVAAEITAQPPDPEGWLRVRSAHFTLYSDAEAERAQEITAGLERLREAFARLSPQVGLRSPVPTRIVAFRDADSYDGYKTQPDNGALKVLGQYLAHRDGNFITLNADPLHLGNLATIQHEYVHELVQHNFPAVPLWFNEGLAEYYSTFAVEANHAFVGRPVARHLRWLRTHPDFSLAEVLTATREQSARHDAESAGQMYAVSWLLVHYLLSGDAERLRGTAELLFQAGRGEDPETALAAALDIDLAGLAERLREYLLGPLPQAGWALGEDATAAATTARAPPAELLVVLGDLLARQRRLAEAESHYDLALAWDGHDAAALSGLAAVRDLEGRLQEAGALHRQALALAPTAALPYLRFGRHLLARIETGGGDGAAARLAGEARSALALAAALEPEFAECRALLGAAQLMPGGEAARGIALLRQVRREQPERADVVFNLLQLYLAEERIGDAAGLLRGPLARLGDAGLLARAGEGVERASLLKAARQALAEGAVEEGLRLFDQAVEVTSDPALRAAMRARRSALRAGGGAR